MFRNAGFLSEAFPSNTLSINVTRRKILKEGEGGVRRVQPPPNKKMLCNLEELSDKHSIYSILRSIGIQYTSIKYKYLSIIFCC